MICNLALYLGTQLMCWAQGILINKNKKTHKKNAYRSIILLNCTNSHVFTFNSSSCTFRTIPSLGWLATSWFGRSTQDLNYLPEPVQGSWWGLMVAWRWEALWAWVALPLCPGAFIATPRSTRHGEGPLCSMSNLLLVTTLYSFR